MLPRLHTSETLADFYSVQSQLTMEMELKQFFVVTPANRIGEEFKNLSGSVMNQFAYLNLALKVIQELNIEPVQTFALLQAVRPVIYHKFDAATSRFVGKPISTAAASGSIVSEALELFTRLTDTYDSIINEARRFGDSQIFIIGSAIHMAMADKAKLILCYLKLYQEVPKNIWNSTNRLYIIAIETNVPSQVFNDKLAFAQHVLSIKQVYIYILLLGSSGSRSLNTDEISALAEFLKEWVKLANIKKFNPASSENSLCIDPASMSMPVFSSEIQDKNNTGLLILDLDKLKSKLEKPFVIQKFVDGVRFTLSPWTTKKILQSWTYHQKRSAPRVGGEQKTLNVRIGILSLGAFPSRSAHSLESIFADDQDKPDYTNRKLELNVSVIRQKLFPLKSIASEKQEPFKPSIVDYSNTGYCLEWPAKSASLLSVNEIMVLQDHGSKQCRLGQIVWMKVNPSGVLQTGIAIIAQQVIPVHIKLINSNPYDDERNMLKGFITGSSLDGLEHYGVLLKNKNVQTGQIVELCQTEAVFPAKLLEPFGNNDRYQSFNFALLQ